MDIPCLVESIFFRTKIEAMLKTLGHEPQFFTSPDAFVDEGRIIVDGMHPRAEEVVEKFPKRCVVFIRHTSEERIARMKGFGCEHVYARSDFFPKLQELLLE